MTILKIYYTKIVDRKDKAQESKVRLRKINNLPAKFGNYTDIGIVIAPRLKSINDRQPTNHYRQVNKIQSLKDYVKSTHDVHRRSILKSLRIQWRLNEYNSSSVRRNMSNTRKLNNHNIKRSKNWHVSTYTCRQ